MPQFIHTLKGCGFLEDFFVNLDKETFEVYEDNYMPHNLKGSFDLNNLPTEEEFLKHFKIEEEEEY